jgi:lipopolysaccharide/colanic/teichoic acid biosynthesis glycosyltransferase
MAVQDDDHGAPGMRAAADTSGVERRAGDALKRGFDVALSGLGLLLSLPLWGLIALAIKLEDGGPVFYVQERVGRDRRRALRGVEPGLRVFRGLKFRSMVPNADRFGPVQAGENDPRITAVGRLLRATAMDELPQLWSIFRGDMSFVGPRALLPQEIELRANGNGLRGRGGHANGNGNGNGCAAGEREAVRAAVHGHGGNGHGESAGHVHPNGERPAPGGDPIPIHQIPGYLLRSQVRPGLTGIAQVHADRDISRRHKFRYDALYVRRRSFAMDVKLLGASFWITFRGKWEHRGRKL